MKSAAELCGMFLNGRTSAWLSAKQSAWLKGQMQRERLSVRSGAVTVEEFQVKFSPTNGCASVVKTCNREAGQAWSEAREAYRQAAQQASQAVEACIANPGDAGALEALIKASTELAEAKAKAKTAFEAYRPGSGMLDLALS